MSTRMKLRLREALDSSMDEVQSKLPGNWSILDPLQEGTERSHFLSYFTQSGFGLVAPHALLECPGPIPRLKDQPEAGGSYRRPWHEWLYLLKDGKNFYFWDGSEIYTLYRIEGFSNSSGSPSLPDILARLHDFESSFKLTSILYQLTQAPKGWLNDHPLLQDAPRRIYSKGLPINPDVKSGLLVSSSLEFFLVGPTRPYGTGYYLWRENTPVLAEIFEPTSLDDILEALDGGQELLVYVKAFIGPNAYVEKSPRFDGTDLGKLNEMIDEYTEWYNLDKEDAIGFHP